jgi:hypothetical protein
MRVLTYLCAAVLIVPQLMIVAAFETLDHVTAGGTLSSFLTNVMELLDLLFGWGGIVTVAAAVVLIGAGFSRRSRPGATLCVIALALYSTVDLTIRIGVLTAVREWLLFLPAMIAVGLCAWTLYGDARAVAAAER